MSDASRLIHCSILDGKVVEITVAFFCEAVRNISVHLFRELILDGDCSVGLSESMCLMEEWPQYFENKITLNSELSCCRWRLYKINSLPNIAVYFVGIQPTCSVKNIEMSSNTPNRAWKPRNWSMPGNHSRRATNVYLHVWNERLIWILNSLWMPRSEKTTSLEQQKLWSTPELYLFRFSKWKQLCCGLVGFSPTKLTLPHYELTAHPYPCIFDIQFSLHQCISSNTDQFCLPGQLGSTVLSWRNDTWGAEAAQISPFFNQNTLDLSVDHRTR